ncbi:DMT family transporter [Gryllotalpicola protaetiae]|uniref:DMT family transporter n=1 Tax=Gryllotalpicola protaetiae TaxID=2419771 RepID=A0A387BSK1_9MICO|nr:DMT family transporter [Gryllotalpicola protaetiae]AYG03996.1 DMT family transporter [Gryllotalpicola protaetiae]
MKALRVDVIGIAFILLWSSGYVVGALATAVTPPLTVMLWRFVFAVVALGAIALIRRESWPRGRELWGLAGVGVLMFALQFGGLYTALSEGMPAGTVALIACSSPLLVAAAGAALRWETLTWRRWVGIALGVVGVVVTLSDRVEQPPSAGALLWTLLGLAGLAAGTLLHGRLRAASGPTAQAAVETAAGAVVMAVWAPLAGALAIPWGVQAVGSFVWLAIAGSVVAPLMLFALIRSRGATGASTLLFAVPAVTAFASWPVLGTPVGPMALLGLVIVGVGLWLARRRAETTRETGKMVAWPTGPAPRARR